MSQTIGVLALQGNYALHQQALERLGVNAPLIYKPEQLAGCDGLVMPGGESSALLKLMAPLNWLEALRNFHASSKKVFGTCAGMILCASRVEPAQASLGLIDITVQRNAYGRQLESHVSLGSGDPAIFGCEAFEMVFIRAPKVTACGDAVQTLATCDDVPVLVRQGRVLCASFHPEMIEKNKIHEFFLTL